MAKLKLDTVKDKLYDILDNTNKITKDYLITNILADTDIKKSAKKEEVIALVKKKVNKKKSIAKKILEDNASAVAIHPSQLEEELGCSKTERKRWEEEGKIRVAAWDSFRKYGRSFDVPYYNILDVIAISSEDIVKWREEHKKKTSQNRKASSKKAVETRNKNKEIIENFKSEYESTLKEWRKVSSITAATLNLAYWTMWMSRLAKSYQVKAVNAIKKEATYTRLKEEYYFKKEKAIELLVKDTKNVDLSIYIPENPHKYHVEHLCEKHYDDWVKTREHMWEYYPLWEYFLDNQKSILNCKGCSVDAQEHYYTLYYVNVKDTDGNNMFSFHIPHPIGEGYLPDMNELPKVTHEEDEGMFRFGRTLEGIEEIIYTDKRINSEFDKAINMFRLAHQC